MSFSLTDDAPNVPAEEKRGTLAESGVPDLRIW